MALQTFRILTPHPKVVAKWKAERYLPDTVVIPQGESRFFQFIGQASVAKLVDPAPEDPNRPRTESIVTECKETTDRPIRREILKMYRVAASSGNGESLYYVEHLEGETFSGKPADHTRIVGKYREPIFSKERDRETGIVTITGHKDGINRYEIPFKSPNDTFIDPSTGEETTLYQLTRTCCSERCLFYAITSTRKYLLGEITLEQFLDAPFSSLTYLGQNGKWPATAESATDSYRISSNANIQDMETTEPQSKKSKESKVKADA